jgi:hypothetical protein
MVDETGTPKSPLAGFAAATVGAELSTLWDKNHHTPRQVTQSTGTAAKSRMSMPFGSLGKTIAISV